MKKTTRATAPLALTIVLAIATCAIATDSQPQKSPLNSSMDVQEDASTYSVRLAVPETTDVNVRLAGSTLILDSGATESGSHHEQRVTLPTAQANAALGVKRAGEQLVISIPKGEPGTGNVVEAVRHMRTVNREIKLIQGLRVDELMAEAKRLQAPYELVLQVHQLGRLPVPNFSAGGIATPADAALMMQLGAETVFVGSGIFKSGDPKKRAEAMVAAATYFDKPEILAEISKDLGEPMVGINIHDLKADEKMADRGW